MRILLVMPVIKYGGSNKMLCELANSLVRKSHDVTILTYYSKIQYQNVDSRVKQDCLNSNINNKWISRNVIQRIPIITKLIKILRNNKYNVVITFGDTSSFDLLLAKLITKDKIIISERVDPYSNRGIMEKFRKLLYVLADGFVFQTEGAKGYYKENIQSRSVVIPNPVINVNIPPKYDGRKTNHIVSVGRLDIFQKRQDLMLKAFSIISDRYPDILLIFYGDGRDKEKLIKIAEQLGISEKVIFGGVKNNIYESIRKSLMLVLTSDFEGIPNALIEAMSVGLPVISTNCSPGGARLLIENEKNGLLVPRGDVDALVGAMDTFLKDMNKADMMGKEALNIVEEFNEHKIFHEWENFIKNVVYN